MLRVNHLIQREISEMLQKNMLDSRYGMVTITEVRVSKDLRYAKVFFSVYGKETQKEEAVRFLHEKTASIQRELGSRIRLRYTPSLQFILDETETMSERIMNLCKDLHLEDDSNARSG